MSHSKLHQNCITRRIFQICVEFASLAPNTWSSKATKSCVSSNRMSIEITKNYFCYRISFPTLTPFMLFYAVEAITHHTFTGLWLSTTVQRTMFSNDPMIPCFLVPFFAALEFICFACSKAVASYLSFW